MRLGRARNSFIEKIQLESASPVALGSRVSVKSVNSLSQIWSVEHLLNMQESNVQDMRKVAQVLRRPSQLGSGFLAEGASKERRYPGIRLATRSGRYRARFQRIQYQCQLLWLRHGWSYAGGTLRGQCAVRL